MLGALDRRGSLLFFLILAAAPPRAAAQAPYVQVNAIKAPVNAQQLIFSKEYNKLAMRNAGSAIRVLDLEDGTITTHQSNYSFVDMSLSPDGRYVFVADYGGENIGYGTPAHQHWIGRLDLQTGAWEIKKTPNVAAHIEALSSTLYVLSSIDQWIDFYLEDWGSGSTTSTVTTFYPGAYYGDIEYDPHSQRLIHGNSGLSSQEIAAFKVSGNAFQRQETSGTYGSASGHGGSAVLATDGSVFYYGSLQVEALDVTNNLLDFPEIIYAANAHTAFADGAYYDASTGQKLGSLGFSSRVYGLNRAGNDLWAYAPSAGELRYFVPEAEVPNLPPTANFDIVSAPTGQTSIIFPLSNDLGFKNPATLSIVTGPQHGTATISGSPGDRAAVQLAYTPLGGYAGPDTIVYEISDGINSGTATVSIDVVSAKAFNDTAVTLANQSVSIPVLKNDVGFSIPVTVTISSQPSQGGSTSISGSPGAAAGISISYSPYSYGKTLPYTDSFAYQVTDGTRTDSAMVSVEVVAYRAIDDVAITAQDTPAIIDVLANDLGFNYQRDLMIFTNPQFGKVIITNDQYSGRKVTYTPDPGYLGTDFFEYAVDDGTRNDIASVSVSVIVDHDGDHIDDRVDDCLDAANANQRDSNGDGFGNWCDADLNNDGRTNFADMALFRAAFGTSNPDADFDGNGSVNFADLARFKALFGKPPGPSATAR